MERYSKLRRPDVHAGLKPGAYINGQTYARGRGIWDGVVR